MGDSVVWPVLVPLSALIVGISTLILGYFSLKQKTDDVIFQQTQSALRMRMQMLEDRVKELEADLRDSRKDCAKLEAENFRLMARLAGFKIPEPT